MRTFFSAMIIVSCWVSVLLANIIRVPLDQSTIQAGIDAAVNDDTVLVADGTYYENIDFKGKAITVASRFLMDSDTTHINNTVINGSQPSDPDKGSVVSFVSGEDTTAVICGFTITGGMGTMYDSQTRVGGGIYCKNSGARICHNKIVYNSVTDQYCDGGGISSWPIENTRYVIVEENLIESNSLKAVIGANGGGIFLVQGKITLNKINGNLSHAQSGFATGGGVRADCGEIANRTLVKIFDNEITYNQAISDQYIYSGYGGGVDITWCNIELVGNVITHNLVSGPELILGGGARLWGPQDICLVKDNIISFNSFMNGHCIGGGMDVVHCSGIIVQGNRFEGNKGSDGGGLVSGHNRSYCVISDNEFIDNTADWGGGLSEWDNTQQTVMNNLFLQNTALYGGGGYSSGDSDILFANNILTKNESRRGGGADFEHFNFEVPPNARIINNTFTENVADSAGGIFIWDYKVIAMNTICWGNEASFAPEVMVQGDEFHVAYSDIRFGSDSIRVTDGGTMNWLEGNIDSDPIFSDSLTLLNSSPCIGKGIASLDIGGTMCYCPETDIAGHSRPDPPGSNPDIGACESPLDTPIIDEVLDPSLNELPRFYSLAQNYPNPFNPSTTIEFSLPKSGFVTLKVYNLLGREVVTLIADKLAAGRYRYEWDAKGLGSGVYLYRLEGKDYTQTRKLTLLK
jgi:hypothetical protein